jgi:carbonic anhydrase
MASGEEVFEKMLEGCGLARESEPQAERSRLAKGQSPYAAVLYCSDSREAAESIFGCAKRGEIFGVRLAGNAASGEAVQSLVYAVEHLRVPLVLVLGHTSCGAVGAKKAGGEPGLAELLSLVEPDVRENVKKQVERLLLNPAISGAIGKGRLAVIGAIHDLETGEIREVVRITRDKVGLSAGGAGGA